LAGLAGNKLYLFQRFLKMKSFTTSTKNYLPFLWRFILRNTRTTRHN